MTHATATGDWFRAPAAAPDATATAAARARQGELTKPPGALGRLEDLAIRLAGLQGRTCPALERIWISVFAADHGVAADGVSAFPQAVTAQMVLNMAHGGAAISVLATRLGAAIELIDLGTVTPLPAHPRVRSAVLGHGTANLVSGPAMTDLQVRAALAVGQAAVGRALADGSVLFIGGEMGIGNSTAAAALTGALLGLPGVSVAGPGTGLEPAAVARKAALIDRALMRHRDDFPGAGDEPLAALQSLGGFEIAALCGACIACAQQRLPALVDGFIASAAALTAARLCPGAGDWLLLGHASPEPGHRPLREALLAAGTGAPLIDLGLRLGEGSGAAIAVPLLRLACDLHAGMATFAEAGVAGQGG